MGSIVAKQYIKLANKPIINHCLDQFKAAKFIDEIQLVVNAEHQVFYQQLTSEYDILPAILGGKTRAESVHNGLIAIEKYNPDYVMIHDSVRPFVSQSLIQELYKNLSDHKAVVPVIPVKDTIKKVMEDNIIATINRDGLYCAQTPQAFDYKLIFAESVSYTHLTLPTIYSV